MDGSYQSSQIEMYLMKRQFTIGLKTFGILLKLCVCVCLFPGGLGSSGSAKTTKRSSVLPAAHVAAADQ